MFTAISRSLVEPLEQKRGGTLHILLSPKTAGTTSGFLGTLQLAPGEVFQNHYHPYSDEHIYIAEGEITIEGDDATTTAQSGTSVLIPRLAPHRLRNTGAVDTLIVFFCSPLAPAPELGHVMLETTE